MDKKIIIGRLAGAYGIKGWSHLISFTDPQENILNYSNWQIQKNNIWQSVSREAEKKHGNGFVVKLTGCDDRDQALLLKNTEIAIDSADLPKAPDNQYYWDDLIGFAVIDLSGNSLGAIDYLFETGSNDVIAVSLDKKQHFIPYLKEVVKSVDVNNKIITVDWEII